jgi:exportin-T
MQLRYVRVAAKYPEVIPQVMRVFLGDSGIGHSHQALATRACYLLMRIVKVLRPSLKNYSEELIKGLIPCVQAIAANPVDMASKALKGTAGRGMHKKRFTVDVVLSSSLLY